jgi:cyanophycin synthetase
VRRGGKAVVLEKGPLGEMMVIREGRRTMPIAWTHLLPATFDGRARMNIQNALAAAGAAHAAGAHLHDIRQGLRTFTTSIYQAPGRLNLVELNGVKIVLDYAHNPHGLTMLGDFVERVTADAPAGAPPGAASWTANLRVAVVATPGDRREEDMRELGRVAARYFDEIIVREDANPRGRRRGDTAERVMEGIREAMESGARAGNAEIVIDEMEAARKALDRSRPGDLVVLCVDYASEVWKEIESRRSLAQPVVMPASEGDGAVRLVAGVQLHARQGPPVVVIDVEHLIGSFGLDESTGHVEIPMEGVDRPAPRILYGIREGEERPVHQARRIEQQATHLVTRPR